MFYNDLSEHIRKRKESDLQIDLNRRDVVIKNLIFAYHVCIASERLLIDAADESLVRGDGCLWDYYRKHFNEEKGEISILKQDLDSGKIDIGNPDKFAMAMVGSQYYMMKHIHPISLIGYMAVQEADPTPIEVIRKLENTYGFDLFRFMRIHAIKDMEHRKEIIEIINMYPASLHPVISGSSDNTLDHYSNAVKSWMEET